MASPPSNPAPNKPLRLRNATCIYCGAAFGQEIRRTKEHVIARKFVPGVDFDNQWNLIAWACQQCNNKKSGLEDDLAALTMQADAVGRFAVDDPRLAEHAKRKGQGSKSRRTNKLVVDSREDFALKGELMPGISVEFGLISSPQVDCDRAFALARFHIQGFFYLITYDREAKQGHFWPGQFGPVALVPKSDWGNSQMRSFQDLICEWEHRVYGIAADEFFKVVIRRGPDEPPVWAWALEWNANFRLIGFFGDPEAMRVAYSELPTMRKRIVEQTEEYTTFMRQELTIQPNQDRLFDLPAKDRER